MTALTKVTIGNCTLYHGDCFSILPKLNEKTDAVISDPPYNTTACDWDVYIPLKHWWHLVSSKSKPTANYVLFAAGHFTVDLANSKYNWFRYDLIWQKNNKVGFFNAGKQPMRSHENILVFGQPGERESAAYNPQKKEAGGRRQEADGRRQEAGSRRQETGGRKQMAVRHNRIRNGGVYPAKEYISKSDGTLHPGSVLQFDSDRYGNTKCLHPTQKPVALLEFLVKSYSSENDMILDPFMGSGTTGIACAIHGRRFVGIEKEQKYFDIAVQRMKEEYEKTNLSSPR